MESLFCIRTISNNNYFFNKYLHRFIFCHPVLNFLLSLYIKGIDIPEWIAENNEKEIIILNYGKTEISDILYYYEKLIFFENLGLYLNFEKNDFLNKRFSVEDVKWSFFNTNVILLETTEKCNLNCFYCGYGKFYEESSSRNNKTLDFICTKSLIDYVIINRTSYSNYQKDLTICFYGGEPLLQISFIKKVVQYIRSLPKLINFEFNIITNGVLLDRHMDFLVKENFNVIISLDGDELNNQYRTFKNSTSSFSHIYNNIKNLKSKYPTYFNLNVSFNSVLHDKNNVNDINNFFYNSFQKIPNIANIKNFNINKKYFHEFPHLSSLNEDVDIQSSKQIFLRRSESDNLLESKIIKEFVESSNECIYKDFNGIFNDLKGRFIPTNTCLPFKKKIFLTANGHIMPCEKIDFKFSFGSINVDRIEIDFENISNFYNQVFDKVSSQCRMCYMNNTCGQCLFYFNLDSKLTPCQHFVDYDDYEKLLRNKIEYAENKKNI